MANATKKRKKRKAKQFPSPQTIAQRIQKSEVRGLFRRAGFDRIKSEGIQFTFEHRPGEIDDIFVFENILVLTEYTVGSAESEHLAKKKLLFDLILKNATEWIIEFSENCIEFQNHLKSSAYSASQFCIRILYCPRDSVADDLTKVCPDIYFFEGKYRKYFHGLAKTIGKSARFEIFKYFNFDTKDVGGHILSSSTSDKNFPGYLLPEGFSDFPKDYRVVSFYADPGTLLERCFVLRADSWRDPDGLYQRMLIPKKIRSMRKYLDDKQRVFVNNVIVSLPSDTTLNDPQSGRNLNAKELERPAAVKIQVPDGYNTIGIIDGQHRIFCYHEGSDTFEKKIAKLRVRQNLLVTGIIYPYGTSPADRQKFEATLFLEINDEQARAKSDLKHGIELILSPSSTIAIAKAVVQRLSDKGPLKGLLKAHYFDDKTKIKTTSIVSYGLRPLVKFEGVDCLFSAWLNTEKEKLSNAKRSHPPHQLLTEYIEYCVDQINSFLVGAKLNLSKEQWDTSHANGLLTPTTINGFVVCIRALVANGKLGSQRHYQNKFSGLEEFKFSSYKSSHWKQLGLDLAQQYFGIK